jgi:uncharacterized membrane protein
MGCLKEVGVYPAAPSSPQMIGGGRICMKIFIISTMVTAVALCTTGILACMVYKGMFTGMVGLNALCVIGEINSYGMMIGGVVLFVLSVFAWACHLKQEKEAAHYTKMVK